MGDKHTSDNCGVRFRGTIPVGHALIEFCFDKPHNVAFKQILSLAEQALNTQAGLTRMLAGHPLSQELSELTPQEALSLLLGITKVTQDRDASQFRASSASASASETVHEPASTAPAQTVTSKVPLPMAAVTDQSPVKAHVTAPPPVENPIVREEPMDMGLDDLDSLNNFSVTP